MSTMQIQKECFICHKQVYLSKPTPDSKWLKTNLDGSVHVDPQKPRAGSYQEQIGPIPDTPTIQEAKVTAALRTEAIAKAHEENMESEAKTRLAIDALNQTLISLAELIKQHLEKQAS